MRKNVELSEKIQFVRENDPIFSGLKFGQRDSMIGNTIMNEMSGFYE